MLNVLPLIACLSAGGAVGNAPPTGDDDRTTMRVFIFAGQSNMVGSDSRAKDIVRYPPYAGLDRPQPKVMFSYLLGREDKRASNGWVALQPIGDTVGPELSFARAVTGRIAAPIAIINCAAGGTTLGGDWNPDEPSGFKLYPLALQLIRTSLTELDRTHVRYRIEGFMWHQGENDMFDKGFRPAYAGNLKNFIARWRRDLQTPNLRFYIGELCTKTVWGMDNRENMAAIRSAQKAVADADPLVDYVPTSHDAVEIGGGAGLHYHYGTLGQLEHGENYASAYLRAIGKNQTSRPPLRTWPYAKGSTVKLFILAGHRNMEGERAFTQILRSLPDGAALARSDGGIAFKYSLGGGFKISQGWEPLGPAGPYDTFGPELSFGSSLKRAKIANVAIAKFTHSGSQINDWTPQGSAARDLNLYPRFVAFVRQCIEELRAKGHLVEVAGIFYHVGENDMAFAPYRRSSVAWLKSVVAASRQDLGTPSLRWFVSLQPTPADNGLDAIDVGLELDALASADPMVVHVRALDLPPQPEKLVLDTAGVVRLGEILGRAYVEAR